MIVKIEGNRIRDWDSFHRVFAEALGFPDFYGRNMDAWIDCLSSVDDPSSGMTRVGIVEGGVLTLQIDNVRGLAERCPGQYTAIVEGVAFVNWRRVERGESGIVALSFHVE